MVYELFFFCFVRDVHVAVTGVGEYWFLCLCRHMSLCFVVVF